jgi:hypothetical protein
MVPVLGSFGNLVGPDMIVIFGLNAIIIGGGIVLLVRLLGSRRASHVNGIPAGERLQKLDSLRRTGLVTEEEYAEQRRRILAEI